MCLAVNSAEGVIKGQISLRCVAALGASGALPDCLRWLAALAELANLWRTTEITMKFMAYNWNPYEIYGVQLRSLYNLWRTTELPMKCMAYN